MTFQLRTLIFLLMFGIFMSNNIIVPVHQLSHVDEDHEASVVNCDVYHTAHIIALSSEGYSVCLPPPMQSVATLRHGQFGTFNASTSTQIRAPPVLA